MMSEKNYVLRVAGKLHRRFISYLTKFYLRDVDGNLNVEALKIYKDYISPKEWGAFVAKRADPAFVEARLNKDELVDNENVQQGIEQCIPTISKENDKKIQPHNKLFTSPKKIQVKATEKG
ncbi:uncharacterized protein [Cicer arietinum]|uniref:uncharacterized protein isoform X3 n=1 Tax=Cicer arietinum TaxID=3827 RepID=UPI003CC57763